MLPSFLRKSKGDRMTLRRVNQNESTGRHSGVAGRDREKLAALSCQHISRMSRAEMACLVLASPLPALRPGLETRLHFHDRPTLQRLVHLARYCSLRRSS